MNIKRESSISCGSDCESFSVEYKIKEITTDNEDYIETPMNIKNEDSTSYGTESDSISPKIFEDIMTFEDIMKYEAASQSINKDFTYTGLDDKQFGVQNIKSELIDGNQQRSQPKIISDENKMIVKPDVQIEKHGKIERRAQKVISVANDLSDDNDTDSDFNDENNIASDSSSSLDVTVNLTYSGKILKCRFCSKKFRGTRDRMDHENSHTGSRPHKCRICSKFFSATSSLHKHMQTHPGAIPQKRINRSDSQGPNSFDCSFCGKTLKCTRDRDEHENTHTGKRPHQCPICPKSFTSSSSLRRHDRVHKDDRRHECQVCKKRFIIKSKLDKHIRANHLPDTDPRRYFPCQLCDAKLESYSLLDLHRRREHRNHALIFTCDYCQKQYRRKDSIVEHMRIHSGQKPMKCNYCPSKFMLQNSKTKHERKCKHFSE